MAKGTCGSKAPECEAVQHSDQMVCHRCKSAWDVNDPEPPACVPVEADAQLRDEFQEIRAALREAA